MVARIGGSLNGQFRSMRMPLPWSNRRRSVVGGLAMRSFPRLGAVNAALISLYFAPVWGIEAVRALTSPYYGFEQRAHAVAASYFRTLFDLGLDGLLRTSTVLAGIK